MNRNGHARRVMKRQMKQKPPPIQSSMWDKFLWLFSTGIEHQPGPPENCTSDPRDIMGWDDDNGITIACSNVTCMESHIAELVTTTADLHVYQEHSADAFTIGGLRQQFQTKNRSLIAGPLDPNVKGHKLGGVAASARSEGTPAYPDCAQISRI